MSFPAAMWSFLEDKSNKKPCPPHFFVGSYLTSNYSTYKNQKNVTYLMNFTIIWVKNPTPQNPTKWGPSRQPEGFSLHPPPCTGMPEAPTSIASFFLRTQRRPDLDKIWTRKVATWSVLAMEIEEIQLKVQQYLPRFFCFPSSLYRGLSFFCFFFVILIRDWHDVSICILVFPINQGSLSSKYHNFLWDFAQGLFFGVFFEGLHLEQANSGWDFDLGTWNALGCYLWSFSTYGSRGVYITC